MNDNEKLSQAILDLLENYSNGIPVNDFVDKIQKIFPEADLQHSEIMSYACNMREIYIMGEKVYKKKCSRISLPPNQSTKFL